MEKWGGCFYISTVTVEAQLVAKTSWEDPTCKEYAKTKRKKKTEWEKWVDTSVSCSKQIFIAKASREDPTSKRKQKSCRGLGTRLACKKQKLHEWVKDRWTFLRAETNRHS